MRNVMRFAASVSHRVFERTWHLEMIQVYLFEQNIQINLSLTWSCVTWKESEWDVQPVRVLCDRKAVVLIHRTRSVIVRTILLNTKTLYILSQIRQDYPLNLSISVSGGKETNKDSLSNGEWSGKSSNLESRQFLLWIVISRHVGTGKSVFKSPGMEHHRGWQSRLDTLDS